MLSLFPLIRFSFFCLTPQPPVVGSFFHLCCTFDHGVKPAVLAKAVTSIEVGQFTGLIVCLNVICEVLYVTCVVKRS